MAQERTLPARRQRYNRQALPPREAQLRDWGLIYGLAFGIQLTEDPEKDREAIAQRALDAARAVYRRWANEIAPRPTYSPAVDAVLVAYDDMGREWDSAVYENEWRRPLYSALFNLRDAIGVPVESGGE